jgi:hypothetical protein
MLDAVASNEHVTQRRLSAQLGVALGLTNIYVRRLIRKGYIKCVNVPSNRLRYLITPRGLAEKTRLTYRFMNDSLRVYREIRLYLSEVLRPCVESGVKRVAVVGTGEAAELAYISLREHGLEPVAVFALAAGGVFLGMEVKGIDQFGAVAFDLVVLATFDASEPIVLQLIRAGVATDKLITLMPTVVPSRKKHSRDRASSMDHRVRRMLR